MRAPLCSSDPAEVLSRRVIDDPHPFYAELRAARPLSRVGDTGVHLVATWDLIEAVLVREADFSANLTGALMRGATGAPEVFALPVGDGTAVIATADEPSHAVHRRLVQTRLATRRVAALEPVLRQWVAEALDPWLAAGGGDFAPLSEVVPARAIGRLLGLPEGDVEKFRTWALIGGDILAGDADVERLTFLATETAAMITYLGEHLDRTERGNPSSDDWSLLQLLAEGVHRGEISRDEAVGIAMVLFSAGGESTASLIGSAMKYLAGDAPLAQRLRSAPDLIPAFVQEICRLEPPFKFHYRAVRRDCELGGYSLAEGDRLMLLWASANRDPAVFDDPEALRLDRAHPRDHMSFGRGQHFCVGAPLARLEARIVIEQVLAKTQHLALFADDPPRYTASILVRRLERLPIAAQSTCAATPR